MRNKKTYPGIHNDKTGWTVDQVPDIYDKTTIAREPFGYFASHLPDGLKEKFIWINKETTKRATENC